MTDRKYRQQGYLGEDGDRPAKRKPGGRGPRREGPRGRGLGAPQHSVFRCASCGQSHEPSILKVDSTCKGCGTDLHTCTHCGHFDPSAPFECRKPLTHRVSKKSHRTDCEFFEPKIAKEFDQGHISAEEAKAAFDDLFDL